MSMAAEAAILTERKILQITDLEKEITGAYEMSAIVFCDPETWKCRCSLNVYPTGISSDAKATPFQICLKVREIIDKATFLKPATGSKGGTEYWERNEEKNEKGKWVRVSWTKKYDATVEKLTDLVLLQVYVQESFTREDK
jgi:hypothetical protein